MKKLVCLLLCLVMVVATFAACGKKNDNEESVDSATETPTGPSEPTPPVTQEAKRNYGLFVEGVIEYVLDDKGRLVEIWSLDSETLDRESAYADVLESWISFVYGADGKLIEFFGQPVTYDGQGNATYGEDEPSTPVIFEYHTNGSIKKLAATLTVGTDSYTTEYNFDEQGRFTVFGTIETSIEGGNTVTEKSIYNFTYEVNKVTISVVYNDVPVEGVSMVMEFDADGKPIKVLEIEGEESDEFGWTWDGSRVASCYEYGTTSQSGSDGQSTPVRYKDEIFFTYDENGNRTKSESKRDGVLKEYTVYTYNAANQILFEKEYNAENVEESSVVYDYDAQGNLLTKTSTKGDNIYVTDGEGRPIREVEKIENDVGSGMMGYEIREIRYEYNTPAGALYDTIEKRKSTNYDNNGTVISEVSDEYWEIRYMDGRKVIDEATGSSLYDGNTFYRDSYGNYIIVDNGVPTGVRYYQKYCGNDGRIFYYTAEGVLTYVA